MKAQSFKILKDKLVKTYRRYGDKACLTTMDAQGSHQYTGTQIANAIEQETEFGMKCIDNLLTLTIDLLARNKMTWEERNTNCRTWVKGRLVTTQKEKKAIGIDTPDKLKQTAGKGGKAKAFKEVLSYLETH
jgi:hypothetical protein